MDLNVKDEILTGEPKYKIKQNDTTLYDNVTIDMITPVQQQGTPINKKLFDTISKHLIPTGIICMWSGSTVPIGWHLCDGTDGTPDLRNRFIVGAGLSYSVGNTGGEAFHTLTTNEMPSHNHNLEFPKEVPGTRPTSRTTLKTYNDSPTYDVSIAYDSISGNWKGNYSVPLSNTGNGQSHENRPPYYALAYIMKIAE